MNNPFSLEGKTILITGASSGIGRQCAISCSEMGAKCILLGRSQERLEETLGNLREVHKHTFYSFNLSNIEGIRDLVIQMVSENGPFDGFVHCAGIEKTLPIKLLKSEDYIECFKVNALSAFEFVKYFYNKKYFNDGGHIVFISSITSIIGRGGVAAYSASKGAINSALRSMAIELAKRNICINAISPGTILTPMMQQYLSSLEPEQKAKRLEGFILGIGHTDDIANACIYLLSDASRWVTGTNLVVDGGYTAR